MGMEEGHVGMREGHVGVPCLGPVAGTGIGIPGQHAMRPLKGRELGSSELRKTSTISTGSSISSRLAYT